MLTYIWGKISGWVMAAGGILAAILVIYLRGRSHGAEEAERKAADAVEKDRERADDIRNDINSRSESDITDELRDNWTRKE